MIDEREGDKKTENCLVLFSFAIDYLPFTDEVVQPLTSSPLLFSLL